MGIAGTRLASEGVLRGGWILNFELTGFANGLHEGCGKRGV